MSHRTDILFLAFFRLCYCFIVDNVFIVFIVAVVVVGERIVGATGFVARFCLCAFNLFLLSFQQATMIFVMTRFLQCWHFGLCISFLVLAACWLTVLICNSSRASEPFVPSSFPSCVTIFKEGSIF